MNSLLAFSIVFQLHPVLAVRLLSADGRLRQQAGADRSAGRSDDAAAVRGCGAAQRQGDFGALASDRLLVSVHIGGQDGDTVGAAADLNGDTEIEAGGICYFFRWMLGWRGNIGIVDVVFIIFLLYFFSLYTPVTP